MMYSNYFTELDLAQESVGHTLPTVHANTFIEKKGHVKSFYA